MSFHSKVYAEYRGEIYHPVDSSQESCIREYNHAQTRANKSALYPMISTALPYLGHGVSILFKRPILFKSSILCTFAAFPLSLWSFKHNTQIAQGYSRLFQIEHRSFRRVSIVPKDGKIVHISEN